MPQSGLPSPGGLRVGARAEIAAGRLDGDAKPTGDQLGMDGKTGVVTTLSPTSARVEIAGVPMWFPRQMVKAP